MKTKNCLIFGGSGQIGSFLIRKLTKNNLRVTVVTRNIHQRGLKIKTQANAGYIDIVEANIFEEKKIEKLFNEADYCINLIGILYEKKGGNTFKNIHSILKILSSNKDFIKNIWSLTFVNERRWDLHFNQGLTIRLPSKNVKKAWDKVVYLNHKFNLLDLGLTEIDLRNSRQILGKVNIDKNLIFKKKNS